MLSRNYFILFHQKSNKFSSDLARPELMQKNREKYPSTAKKRKKRVLSKIKKKYEGIKMFRIVINIMIAQSGRVSK